MEKRIIIKRIKAAIKQLEKANFGLARHLVKPVSDAIKFSPDLPTALLYINRCIIMPTEPDRKIAIFHLKDFLNEISQLNPEQLERFTA